MDKAKINIGVAIATVLAVVMLFMLNNIEMIIMENEKDVEHVLRDSDATVNNIKENELSLLYEKKADVVFDGIYMISDDAYELVDKIAINIEKEVLSFYDNSENLKHDLKSIKDGSTESYPILDAIEDNIKDVTLNEVLPNSKDNNDLIMFLVDIIIGDLSDNCATGERTRTLEKEISNENLFSKTLSMSAWRDIVYYKKRLTYWSFVPVSEDKEWYDEIKYMDVTNMDYLKKKFIYYNSDMSFLDSIEFLTTKQMHEYNDILGNKVKFSNGQKNEDSFQMRLTSGFILKDQLENYPEIKKKIDSIDTEIDYIVKKINYEDLKRDIKIDNINREFEIRKSTEYLKILVVAILFMMMFFYVYGLIEKRHN